MNGVLDHNDTEHIAIFNLLMVERKEKKLYKLHIYDFHIAVEILFWILSQIKDKKMNGIFSYPALYYVG